MSRFQNEANGIVVAVADEKDHRFVDGWKRFGSDQPRAESETPDKSWTVSNLKSYAEVNGIDLFDSTKKDDILAAIAIADEF